MTDDSYDVIVIGAGSTGENVAARAAASGLSAVVVEDDLVGGDCSYWACIPSKALLRPAEEFATARRVPGVQQAITGDLDVDAVLAHRNEFVSGWDDSGQVSWLDSASLPLVRGHGRLSGERQVTVAHSDGSETTLIARHAVVICTGSDPALPPVSGLAESKVWTSRDATSATTVPGRLAILGGGVAACEMASAYRALGSEVVMVEREPRLLPQYEPLAAEELARVFTEQGIDVRTGATVTEVAREENGQVTLTVDTGDTVTADELLAATGRQPRTTDVGLDTVGLEPGAWLDVDDTLQVREVDGGWLYAAGDVNARALLTHMGKYQARICGDVIAARARADSVDTPAWSRYAATADHTAVPQVVFTNPQVAAVGRTEDQARTAGLDVQAVQYDVGSIAGGALHVNGYEGKAKLVIDTERRVVVGATFIGPAVAELVHAATIVVVGEVPLDRLWHAVPSFPTLSEIWLRLLETYGM